jgi:pimeloyl-ACP methyl ester carboxylesterase
VSLLALPLALLACMTPVSHTQAVARARADEVVQRGYQPAEHVAIDAILQQWTVGAEKVPVALTLPRQGTALPVVLYLPGLGQSAEAGLIWHHAWAQAGYAVISVQALDEDAQAWSSPQARSFDFTGLARERHGDAPLRQRLDRLAALLDEARRRARDGDPLCSRLDFSRMVVAGYDLGAQAAMVLAGAHEVGGGPDALAGQFRGAIVLSPVLLSGQGQRERFGSVTKPVLSITGPGDVDPTGLVATPMRTTAFSLMPPGDKFELLLNDASHATLSGQPEEERAAPRDVASRRGRRTQNNGGATSDAVDEEARSSRVSDRRLAEGPPPGRAEDAAAIATVSAAFLDAHLRARPEAQHWLDEQVPAWLRGLGSWQKR